MISWTRTSLPKKDCTCLLWLEGKGIATGPEKAEYDKALGMFFADGIVGIDNKYVKAWAEIQEPEKWDLCTRKK